MMLTTALERTKRPDQIVYSAKEHEPLAIPIDDVIRNGRLELFPDVVKRGLFALSFRGRELVLQPGPYIGLLPINERILIEVHPRVPVSNLGRILSIARHLPLALENHLREYELQQEPIASLLDTLTWGLLDSIREIEHRGLQYEYRRATESTSFPRGRIDLGTTMSRFSSRGIAHKVVCTQYVRTPDTPPNRCIKYALWFLAQKHRYFKPRGGSLAILSSIGNAYHHFDDVSLDQLSGFLGDPWVRDPDNLPDRYAYYRRALTLALAILKEESIRIRGFSGELELESLHIRLDELFEDYIRISLARHLADIEPSLMVLDGNLGGETGARKGLFDDMTNPSASPDIVIDLPDVGDVDGHVPAIIEVKYKPIRGLPDRADLNQLISYSSSYKAPIGVVLSLRNQSVGPVITPLGRIGNSSFFQYLFDLGSEDLPAEERKLAVSIKDLVLSTNG